MSLEGAKIINLIRNEDGSFSQGDVVLARGKKFKFGYYMDCDVVLEHPDAIGVHCVINCDAFGRVTIENCCPEQRITLNGKVMKQMRPLLHNTEIGILDKKFLWQFKGSRRQSLDLDTEDRTGVLTPVKKLVKTQQAPNSEPARRWRMELQKRLTINNFAHYIKATDGKKAIGENDENMAPVIEIEYVSPSKSSPQASRTVNLIDLQTPRVDGGSFNKHRTPLSCCNLSETVITSYSPRETGVRPEKSFAIVQKPRIASAKPSPLLSNLSLGPFNHLSSPRTINHRSSMHLIDLTTPMKRIVSSPSRARGKPTPKLQKQQPTQSQPKASDETETSTNPSRDTSVFSVTSTDEESVIEISDERASPSPIIKTPSRPRTPQSLMKRAILSSAKKVAVAKRLQQPVLQPSSTPGSAIKTADKCPTPASGSLRIHTNSTPQRKSLCKFSLPSESPNKQSKPNSRFMATSTPFRPASCKEGTPRRSIMRSPSTSFAGNGNNKSRTSLMLQQALSGTPIQPPKRKSVSFSQSNTNTHHLSRARKSESFLDRIESRESINNEVLNATFSIEEDNEPGTNEPEGTPKKDATFSPKKESESLQVIPPGPEDSFVCATPTTGKPTKKRLSNKVTSAKKDTCEEEYISLVVTDEEQEELDEDPAPQDRRPSSYLYLNQDVIDCDDFEGLDTIFKTPKAKNLMVLSSPKSVALQKTTTPSAKRINSSDFNLTSNLEDIFKTPQSELITDETLSTRPPTTVDNDKDKPLSPEEAFDKLVGRPIIRQSYTRKSTPLRKLTDFVETLKDTSLPKTDIEEWIENVSESIPPINDSHTENEVSFSVSNQNELSTDPLMLSAMSQHSKSQTSRGMKQSPNNETAMTIEEEQIESGTPKRNPLELPATPSKRSISPNISGIDLLDRTPESIFSETLAVSDDSSSKEHERTACLPEVTTDQTITNLPDTDTDAVKISPSKALIEMERAFEHFETERKKLRDGKRLASTPDAKKPVHRIAPRRTMGNQTTLDEFFDPKTIKAAREMELEFENFQETPTDLGIARLAQTPDGVRPSKKDVRRSMGDQRRDQKCVFDVEKARMEQIFQNFEEKPKYSGKRSAKTPECIPKSKENHRRTMGSNIRSEITLDLGAVKQRLEMERAFENFEEEPEPCQERLVKTPDHKPKSLKDTRRTMGSNLGSEVTLDLKVTKQQVEMERAFENFEEEPERSKERLVKTPERKPKSLTDHRRTMGSNLSSEVTLDLKAAKQQVEIERAFENFEEEPERSKERLVKTPEHKPKSLRDYRRTMGSNLGSEVTLDLKAAKQQVEMEEAFVNFEDERGRLEERRVRTPEHKSRSLKDNRRTMGSNLVSEVTLDLQAAKEQVEMERAFENFQEEPEPRQGRLAKTPDHKLRPLKDHRRTIGSNLVSEVTLDLRAAKQQVEMEQAFENFDEKPERSKERLVKTPEHKPNSLRDHRRTMGSNLNSEVTLDMKAAKQQVEMERAFENFEEEPERFEVRRVKTPEQKPKSLKDNRRTMGSNLNSEVTLDFDAAKQQVEIERAFENFAEEPDRFEERRAKTPENKPKSLKEIRRTMGNNLNSEVTLDLKAAKQQVEMERAFENFEEEPERCEERRVRTPEHKPKSLKDNRRTMGSNLISEVTLDLQAAKQQVEMERAFENFEEEPERFEERRVRTPEHKPKSLKDNRRTMGSNLISEVTLDLEAAKQQVEMERAFENFEEEPERFEERRVRTPEHKPKSLKDNRRTMGSNLISEVTLDLQAAKQQVEMERAFENFEEEPEQFAERRVKTPEHKTKSLKDNRRTMGSNLNSVVTIDLKATKQQVEMERAFKNFKEEPERGQERLAKTPDRRPKSLKDQRRTMGSNLGSEVTLDLKSIKLEREIKQNLEEKQDNEKSSRTSEEKELIVSSNTQADENQEELGQSAEAIKRQRNKQNNKKEGKTAHENSTAEPKTEEKSEASVNDGTQIGTRKKKLEKNVNKVPIVPEVVESPVVMGLRTTRQRRNIHDEESSTQLTDKVKSKSKENPRPRTRRQNSVDKSIINLNSKTPEPTSVVKTPIQTIEQAKKTEADSTEAIDSAEDDTKPVSAKQNKRSQRKRLSNETKVQAVEEPHLNTVEEEQPPNSPPPDNEKPIKSTRLRAGRRALSKEITPISVLNLKTEPEEIVSSSPVSSTNRIRGRRAQLKVTLLDTESSDATISVKMEPIDEPIIEDEAADSEHESRCANTSIEAEVIPSTPAPLNTRRRALLPRRQQADSSASEIVKGGKSDSESKTEEQTQARKRGRKAAPKDRSYVSDTPKSKDSVAVTSEATAREEAPSEHNLKPCTDDVEEFIPSTPAPSVSRTRKLVIKPKSDEAPVENSTQEVPPNTPDVLGSQDHKVVNVSPIRRGGRRGAKSVKDSVESKDPDVKEVKIESLEDTDQSVPAMTRKRRGRNLQQTKPTEAIQPAVEEESKEDSAEKFKDAPVAEDVPVMPKRTRKTPASMESSTPAKKPLRKKDTVDQDITDHMDHVDYDTEETVLPPKKRSAKPKIKTKPVEISNETSSPIRKRTRRGVQEKVLEVSTSSIAEDPKSDTEHDIPSANTSSQSRTRQAALKSDSKRGKKLTSVTILIQEEQSASHEDSSVEPEAEAKPTTRSTRGRKAIAKEEESSKPNENLLEVKKSTRGRRNRNSPSPASAISEEPNDLASEEKTQKKPVRGRNAQLPKKDTTTESTTSHTEEENSASTDKGRQRRNRKVSATDVAAGKESKSSLTPYTSRTPRGNAKVEPSDEVDHTEEENSAATAKGRQRRNRKVSATDVAPGKESESRLTPYTSRTRRGNAKVEPSDEVDHTEEENSAATAKDRQPRNRKVSATDVAAGKETESSLTPYTSRTRRGNIRVESSDEVGPNKENKEPQVLKTRGRKPAQKEPVANSAPQGTTAIDSDNERYQPSEAQKNTTRSRKASATTSPITKTEEKIVPRKGLRRNIDIADQNDPETPSKRLRRKPNIPLSSDFVS